MEYAPPLSLISPVNRARLQIQALRILYKAPMILRDKLHEPQA